MNTIKKRVLVLFTFAVIIILQGCGPLESVSGDRSMTYEEDFDTMVETVEQAIRGQSLEINFAEKSDDGRQYVVLFHATSYLNTQNQRKDEGEIIIEHLEDNKTKVTINNPEYEPTVPSHHRKKYDKELKEEIEKILGQS